MGKMSLLYNFVANIHGNLFGIDSIIQIYLTTTSTFTFTYLQ